MSAHRRRVLFAVAAGPRMGFGHLLRSRALARALDVPLVIALRSRRQDVKRAARAIGATFVSRSTGATLDAIDLVVIDDPNPVAGRRALRLARRAGAAVATVHDLGAGYLPSDLLIDGTFGARASRGTTQLTGVRHAVLDPAFAGRRQTPRVAGRVVIALGGGAHIGRFGRAIALEILRVRPAADVRLAAGFSTASSDALPAGACWIAPDRLRVELGCCAVAVLGGGMTLYEACALGTPAIALAVASAQRATVRACAAAGAALDGGLAGTTSAAGDVARQVARVLSSPALAERLSRRGRALVDGRGALRVAAHLDALMAARPEVEHAA